MILVPKKLRLLLSTVLAMSVFLVAAGLTTATADPARGKLTIDDSTIVNDNQGKSDKQANVNNHRDVPNLFSDKVTDRVQKANQDQKKAMQDISKNIFINGQQYTKNHKLATVNDKIFKSNYKAVDQRIDATDNDTSDWEPWLMYGGMGCLALLAIVAGVLLGKKFSRPFSRVRIH